MPAGALMSSSRFEVPPYQREYAWQEDEVSEFWNDLRDALHLETYFLGLVILTDEDGPRRHVVDGQQRLLTLTLLAAALYHEAMHYGRSALADRLKSDFLYSIDYATDEILPRVKLTDATDNETLQSILNSGRGNVQKDFIDEVSLSRRLEESFDFIRKSLSEDLARDPFQRLGLWTEFITNRVYFAVFIHPDAATAYRVFEVINTRGRELTTADLLKNYVLSQTAPDRREARYKEWQRIAKPFSQFGPNALVQFIRHVVTVEAGHILPKDLYDFLAQRTVHADRKPPSVDDLMSRLRESLPLYAQMMDPSLDGPADTDALRVFSALDSLGVIAVRPILLAISKIPDADAVAGMRHILKLVVRRMVVGNLGTGNVERRFGEAAKRVFLTNDWHAVERELDDLNPIREEFLDKIGTRSYNKGTLSFLRRSIIQKTITPNQDGTLHSIMPRQQGIWSGFTEESAAFWSSTLANTYLSTLERRPKDAVDWQGFKVSILPSGIEGEWQQMLRGLNEWNAEALEFISKELAEAASNVWY
jgi:hypothetical protein